MASKFQLVFALCATALCAPIVSAPDVLARAGKVSGTTAAPVMTSLTRDVASVLNEDE